MTPLGDKIAFFRNELGISQGKLAKLAGVSQATIANLENGKNSTTKKLPAIAKALGKKVAELDPNFNDAYITGPLEAFHARVKGVAQLGSWRDFESLQENNALITTDVPVQPGRWLDVQQFAYLVRGNSMELERILDGDYVICVPYFEARTGYVDGDRVVIERTRGDLTERSVRQIEVRGNHLRFCTRSVGPSLKPATAEARESLVEEDGTQIKVCGLIVGRWSPF